MRRGLKTIASGEDKIVVDVAVVPFDVLVADVVAVVGVVLPTILLSL